MRKIYLILVVLVFNCTNDKTNDSTEKKIIKKYCDLICDLKNNIDDLSNIKNIHIDSTINQVDYTLNKISILKNENDIINFDSFNAERCNCLKK